MRFERFISKRFMPLRSKGGGFSGPLSVTAVASIALGVLVMVMAISILRGFQNDIAEKVSGFGSHITINEFTAGEVYDENPITVGDRLRDSIIQTRGVSHVQAYATKGGMVKTESQIYGVLLRGLEREYDTTFFSSCLSEGRLPRMEDSAASNEVLISTTIAQRLGLHTGDKMRTYFWQGESYRSRAFTVSGLYNTDLTEMDERFIIGDLRQVQKLNGWGEKEVGGLEVLVEDMRELEQTAEAVAAVLPYELMIHTVVDTHQALFSWLDLLNANITLILVIMSIVCAVAIVSALLIMIFEKSSTIGLLKALGATDASVRRIFLIKASGMIGVGVLIGDAVALLLSEVQRRWQVVRLDPESYSMAHVPVELDISTYIGIDLGTMGICLLALLLPMGYISRISPARTMRIEN